MNFLAIGHVTLDKRNGAFPPGGTGTFAARIAKRLDYEPATLTRAGNRYPFACPRADSPHSQPIPTCRHIQAALPSGQAV